LDPRIGKSCDYGVSFLEEFPESPASEAYCRIVDRIKEKLDAGQVQAAGTGAGAFDVKAKNVV
jgi:hypothetical protein